MARLRCEVLVREGKLPRVVRDEGGRVLRLYAEAPPAGAGWVGMIDGTGVWGKSVEPPEEEPAAPEVVWLDTPALDEIGVEVGPDRGDALGLFDSPTTASTGEHTEGPASGPDRVMGEQRRTAVLAWIAAQAADAPGGADTGVPCEPLKRLIADEPLDPIPALDGIPRPRPAEPRREPPDRELGAEREDTATQIEGFEAMAERRREGTTGSAPHPEEPTTHAPPPSWPARLPWILLLAALGVAALTWALRAG